MSRKVIVRAIFCAGIFYFSAAAFADRLPGGRGFRVDCEAGKGVIELSIESGDYTISRSDGYDDVFMEGYEPYISPGDPTLPHRMINIAVPPETDLKKVRILADLADGEALPGEYTIRPAPPFAANPRGREEFFWGENKNIVNGKNVDVYESDRPFPAESVTMMPPGVMRKWKFVRLDFSPFSYNPVKKELALIKTIRLRVFYEEAKHLRVQHALELADTIMDEAAKEILDNHCMSTQWYVPLTREAVVSAGGDYSYVIITTEAIKGGSAELPAFEDFKEEQGFNVLTVTESAEYDDIEGTGAVPGWGGGTGDGAAENLRGWLAGNYLAMGIEYVLLIGDPHPDTGSVPMKMCWPRSGVDLPDGYIQAPTDYYFTDLTGNWDLDGDGLYGEFWGDIGVGGIDAYPEVYTGRIPVYGSDYTALDGILRKTIEYGTSAGDVFWRFKVLLPMEPSSPTTHGYPLGEGIRSDYAIPNAWSSCRIYDEDYGCDPEMTPCDENSVVTEWANHYGLVTWWTHGGETGAVDVFDVSQCAMLDDNCPSFTFQCSCLNGHPETANNLGYSLLRQGAIGTVSSTRISYYSPGDGNWKTSGSSNYQAYLYSGNIVDRVRAGKSLCQVKINSSHSQATWWMNKLVFNLYGDPAIKIDDFLGYSISGAVTLAYPGYIMGMVPVMYQVRPPGMPPAAPLFCGEAKVSVIPGETATGSIGIGVLPEGTYDVALKMKNRVADMVESVIIEGGDATGLEFTLWAGDGDGNDNMGDLEPGDNDVDWFDYYLLYLQYLGLLFPDLETGCNFDCDLDVDFADYYGLYFGYMNNPDPGNWYY